jgi:hypothetical protein
MLESELEQLVASSPALEDQLLQARTMRSDNARRGLIDAFLAAHGTSRKATAVLEHARAAK